jgi:radical SAM protein with 4Fe4S-binding SPASM domain
MPSLEITTQIGCPLMCTFCPQDKLNKAYRDPIRKMTLETFQTVLSKLTPDYRIIFAGYTEPWANPLCNQFVAFALKQGFKISIYSTLYNINIDQAKELATLLDQYHDQVVDFWIHYPDRNGNMRGFKYSQEYEQVLNCIQSMRHVRTFSMTMDSESKIHPSINANVKPVSWYLHTRADNLDLEDIKGQPVNAPPKYEYIVECTRDKNLKSNILLPNGDVILCCMDYGLKHKLGNLLESSLDQVIDSEERKKVLELSNQLGYTDKLLCKSCNDAFCHTPWNNKKVYEIVLKQDPEFRL